DLPINVFIRFEAPVDTTEIDAALAIDGELPQLRRWVTNEVGQSTLHIRFQATERESDTKIRIPNAYVKTLSSSPFALEIRRVKNNTARVNIEGIGLIGEPQDTNLDLGTLYQRRLPLKPTQVTISFKFDVVRESVEESIRKHIRESTPQANVTFLWNNDREVAVLIDTPSPSLTLNYTGAKDSRGLTLVSRNLVLVFDGSREVLTFDPESGKSIKLRSFDFKTNWGIMSQEGKYLALLRLETESKSPRPRQRVLIMDIESNDLKETDYRVGSPEGIQWLPRNHLLVKDERVILNVETGEKAPYNGPARGVVSPDGKWVASYRIQEMTVGHSTTTPVPVDLLLENLDTGTTTELKGASGWIPPKGKLSHFPLAWSPNSQLLTTAEWGGGDGFRIVTFEVNSWKRKVLVPKASPGVGVGSLLWSPRSNAIIAGREVLLLDSQQSITVQGSALPTSWSPDGKYVLVTDWDDPNLPARLWLVNIPIKKSVELGDGISLGWLANGRALLLRPVDREGLYDPTEDD
ncbi:MAG: hypothetical protein M1553_07925, partial [Firmicutes bacterium]|nr:hypothetical protein [Bacillota bacterium]